MMSPTPKCTSYVYVWVETTHAQARIRHRAQTWLGSSLRNWVTRWRQVAGMNSSTHDE